jgi:hypothetical protein
VLLLAVAPALLLLPADPALLVFPALLLLPALPLAVVLSPPTVAPGREPA